MESVFQDCNCSEDNKVKYSSCTLKDSALTWWSSYTKSVGINAAYSLKWEDLKQMLIEEYCSRSEVRKLKDEFRELKVVNNDVVRYTQRFLELTSLFPSLATPEYKKIERYICGLPPPSRGITTLSKPETIQKAIQIAHELNIKTIEDNTTREKRKAQWLEDINYIMSIKSSSPIIPHSTQGNCIGNKPQDKRRKTGQTHGHTGKTGYMGTKPLCHHCNHHHTGNCALRCVICRKFSPTTKKEQSTAPKMALDNCFNCGQPGHFSKKCPKNGQGKAVTTIAEEARQGPN